MKITIDTDKKEISVQDNSNLKELFDLLQGLFPEGEWMNWSIIKTTETQVININGTQPKINSPSNDYPYDPFRPYVTYCAADPADSVDSEMIGQFKTTKNGLVYLNEGDGLYRLPRPNTE